MIWIIAAAAAIVGGVVFAVRAAARREKEIYENGYEVDAVVFKVETSYDHDSHRRSYYPYVKYIGDDGHEHEARVNVCTNFPYGRRMRVKYLPSRYDYVVFVSQECS